MPLQRGSLQRHFSCHSHCTACTALCGCWQLCVFVRELETKACTVPLDVRFIRLRSGSSMSLPGCPLVLAARNLLRSWGLRLLSRNHHRNLHHRRDRRVLLLLRPLEEAGSAGLIRQREGPGNRSGFRVLLSVFCSVLLCSSLPVHRFTTFFGTPSKKLCRFFAVMSRMRCLASFAAQEMCGVMTVFLAVRSGLSLRMGSVETTSSPAA